MTDPSGGPAAVPTPPADSPGLYAVTVAALQGAGLPVSMDPSTETFEVPARQDNREPVLGVVLRHTHAVIFYAVRDDVVPEENRAAVEQLVAQANNDLFTCCFEFDSGAGILSLRAGVCLGGLQIAAPVGSGPAGGTPPSAVGRGAGPLLSRETFAALLIAALQEVEDTAAEYAAAVTAVAHHGASPVAALAELRQAGAGRVQGVRA